MQIDKINVFVGDDIIIEDSANYPFNESISFPLKDWETIKNYIDNEIKSKSKATDSHE